MRLKESCHTGDGVRPESVDGDEDDDDNGDGDDGSDDSDDDMVMMWW